MSTALFVGRFQPFHNGHLEVIKRLSERYGKVIVIIGSANESGTPDNPFSVEERIEMIRRALEAGGITNFEISSVEDFNDDALWTSAIMKAYDFDVVYSRNEWTLRCFRKLGVKTRKHCFYHERKYNGTEIRKRIVSGRDWHGLVPPQVFGYMKEIGGEERVKKIMKEA
jgi:nicotinamide-nucleotide adenylyltransferase